MSILPEFLYFLPPGQFAGEVVGPEQAQGDHRERERPRATGEVVGIADQVHDHDPADDDEESDANGVEDRRRPVRAGGIAPDQPEHHREAGDRHRGGSQHQSSSYWSGLYPKTVFFPRTSGRLIRLASFIIRSSASDFESF